eukprot:gene15192-21266_t
MPPSVHAQLHAAARRGPLHPKTIPPAPSPTDSRTPRHPATRTGHQDPETRSATPRPLTDPLHPRPGAPRVPPVAPGPPRPQDPRAAGPQRPTPTPRKATRHHRAEPQKPREGHRNPDTKRATLPPQGNRANSEPRQPRGEPKRKQCEDPGQPPENTPATTLTTRKEAPPSICRPPSVGGGGRGRKEWTRKEGSTGRQIRNGNGKGLRDRRRRLRQAGPPVEREVQRIQDGTSFLHGVVRAGRRTDGVTGRPGSDGRQSPEGRPDGRQGPAAGVMAGPAARAEPAWRPDRPAGLQCRPDVARRPSSSLRPSVGPASVPAFLPSVRPSVRPCPSAGRPADGPVGPGWPEPAGRKHLNGYPDTAAEDKPLQQNPQTLSPEPGIHTIKKEVAEIVDELFLSIINTKKEVADRVGAVDTDGSGEVEYEEFIRIMTDTLEKAAKEAEENGDGGQAGMVPFSLMSTAYKRKRFLSGIMGGNRDFLKHVQLIKSRSADALSFLSPKEQALVGGLLHKKEEMELRGRATHSSPPGLSSLAQSPQHTASRHGPLTSRSAATAPTSRGGPHGTASGPHMCGTNLSPTRRARSSAPAGGAGHRNYGAHVHRVASFSYSQPGGPSVRAPSRGGPGGAGPPSTPSGGYSQGQGRWTPQQGQGRLGTASSMGAGGAGPPHTPNYRPGTSPWDSTWMLRHTRRPSTSGNVSIQSIVVDKKDILRAPSGSGSGTSVNLSVKPVVEDKKDILVAPMMRQSSTSGNVSIQSIVVDKKDILQAPMPIVVDKKDILLAPTLIAEDKKYILLALTANLDLKFSRSIVSLPPALRASHAKKGVTTPSSQPGFSTFATELDYHLGPEALPKAPFEGADPPNGVLDPSLYSSMSRPGTAASLYTPGGLKAGSPEPITPTTSPWGFAGGLVPPQSPVPGHAGGARGASRGGVASRSGGLVGDTRSRAIAYAECLRSQTTEQFTTSPGFLGGGAQQQFGENSSSPPEDYTSNSYSAHLAEVIAHAHASPSNRPKEPRASGDRQGGENVQDKHLMDSMFRLVSPRNSELSTSPRTSGVALPQLRGGKIQGTGPHHSSHMDSPTDFSTAGTTIGSTHYAGPEVPHGSHSIPQRGPHAYTHAAQDDSFDHYTSANGGFGLNGVGAPLHEAVREEGSFHDVHGSLSPDPDEADVAEEEHEKHGENVEEGDHPQSPSPSASTDRRGGPQSPDIYQQMDDESASDVAEGGSGRLAEEGNVAEGGSYRVAEEANVSEGGSDRLAEEANVAEGGSDRVAEEANVAEGVSDRVAEEGNGADVSADADIGSPGSGSKKAAEGSL